MLTVVDRVEWRRVLEAMAIGTWELIIRVAAGCRRS
jgi:hypothetical protein